MKKVVTVVVAGILAMSATTVYAAINATKNSFPMYVNGAQIDIPSYIIEDHTYYQLKDLSEKIGFEVDFKDDKVLVTTETGNGAVTVSGPETRPVTNTKVLLISSVDINTRTIMAGAGYFQKPTGDELYLVNYQFQMLQSGYEQAYVLSNNIQLLFKPWNGNNEFAALKSMDELTTKVKDGYVAWEAVVKDREIISLTNVPWRQTSAFELGNLISKDGINTIDVRAINVIEYNRFGKRFDLLNVPTETLTIDSVSTFIIDENIDPSGLQSKKVSFDEFITRLARTNPMNAYVIKNGSIVVEIHTIFSV